MMFSDAHAACAMYMAKNDINKQMIFRGIEVRAKELLKPPHSTAPIEVLARVQSLLLYQVIRLYDGDVNPQNAFPLAAYTRLIKIDPPPRPR
jgi:hypothetical protein